jgi:glyoxylase-like metal-dependent hydrolase (beta-lactamase superfamily II)
MRSWKFGVAGIVALAVSVNAQTDFSKVEITTTPLGSGLAMLAGAGGNIVASAGEDGVFIVDDEFAELHPKIRAALAKMSDRPVRFVINTHWHGDHTGDNANLAGEGAVIIAQDNVFRRMSTEQFIKHLNRTVPASPKAALPVVTFNDEATLHLNGQAVHLVHVKNAHTDGDVLVHFPEAGVLHMGDCFFNGMYPIIDTGTGGTIDGYVAAVDRGLVLAAPGTKVVPGHGTLGTREDLAAFSAMLKEARTAIAAAKAAGKSADETVAAKPTAALDERWGKGFVKPDAFVLTVYDTLPAR